MPKGQSNRRRRLAEAQNWRCAYCAGLMHQDGNRLDGATVEHLLPLVLGGARSSENLVAACRACNNTRSGFYSARIFYSVRRWQLRKGRWPSCTFPTKKVRKLVFRVLGEATQAHLARTASAASGVRRPRFLSNGDEVASRTAAGSGCSPLGLSWTGTESLSCETAAPTDPVEPLVSGNVDAPDFRQH